MTRTEQMLEMVLRNQVLILIALYETAGPAEFRQKIWAAALETEDYLPAPKSPRPAGSI